MPKRRLIWYIFPIYLLTTFAALLAVTGYTVYVLHDFYREERSELLEVRGRLVARETLRILGAEPGRLDTLYKELGAETGTRYTFIAPNGKVLADSEEDPAAMDNHGDRPEVLQALGESGKGEAVRFSHTLNKAMLYLALPLQQDGELAGVIRCAFPMVDIRDTLRAVYRRSAYAVAVVTLLAAAASYLVARRITRPLENMRQGAERFAKGELGQRLSMPFSMELAALAGAMNKMAQQLDERLRTVLNQRNQLDAILASMVEGVLAVDTDEQIITLNGAAGRLLDLQPADAEGKPIQAVVRNVALQELVTEALSNPSPVEREIVLHNLGEQVVQAHGTVLRDAEGRRFGAVIVLNDVTRLRRLEQVRRDFVANVSHELRTPITSIKGFVETLLDGALADRQEAERFLNIVLNQSNRLNAILEDLLALSRIEEGEEKGRIQLEEYRLKYAIDTAIQLCGHKAQEKGIQIETSCPEELVGRVNPPLLEQALVNLIDNAVKYSEQGQTITVSASAGEEGTVIAVEDRGCGIPRDHLPRLFERFYRVEKARSRRMGGTGLGLAIVKHIAKAHGGRVDVQSTPGKGSTFTLHLPR